MVGGSEDERLWEAYYEADHRLRVRQTKVGCVLVLLLMPAGTSLDYFVYNQSLWSIFQARMWCSAFVLGLFLLLYTERGQAGVRVISFLWALAPMLTICWMIVISEDPASAYYAGLNLMIIGACLLLPYTLLEASLYCAVVLASYIVACLLTPIPSNVTPEELFSDGFNNAYFITLTSIICATYCFFDTRGRVTDFRLRHELDVRNRQLVDLDRLKSQFFGNVSHELRTPLTLVISPVEELLNKQSALPAAARQSLQLVRENAMRLLRLINDLLEIVRLEEGRLSLKLKAIQIDEFISGLVESVRALAQRNRLTIEFQPGNAASSVLADESRLEKILLNLLMNAIKFTPKGGQIEVRCWHEGDWAKVEVADTGIGIAGNDLPYIFDRFRQADGSDTRSYQGLGLGLALSKELVEEHGGRLSATSVVDRGSRFLLEIPLASAESIAAAQQQDVESEHSTVGSIHRDADRIGVQIGAYDDDVLEAKGTGSTRLLIVDDEPDMRRFLVNSLSEEHTVFQAADGENGLQLAKERKPQVAVLDMMLPGISGLDICRALRSDESVGDMKILILTARIDEEVKIAALEAGADDFLTKPFSTLELKTRIRNLVATGALQEDLRQRNEDLKATLDRLRAAEAQLVQSEKMNALGSLAAGLLHEINNPLNYTMMAFQSLKSSIDLDVDSDIAETVNDIDAGMKRICDILADLRNFAYPEQAGKLEPFEFGDALVTALRFASSELEGIEVDSHQINGRTVVGSKTQITQVLLNLMLNAVHAVKPLRDQRSPKIEVTAEESGERLVVSVRDNGVGIEPEVVRRVFDPFFTTKAVGEGTGLGLSVCHTIVENHGGDFKVLSETGSGTEMVFDLPLWQRSEHHAARN